EMACDRIEERARRGGRPSGLPTGFVEVDKKTAGLQDSELVVLAARPGTGKTSFALQATRHVAVEEGRAVFFVSLEMSLVGRAAPGRGGAARGTPRGARGGAKGGGHPQGGGAPPPGGPQRPRR